MINQTTRVKEKRMQMYKYIVAIGISTGGPKALAELVAALPTNLSATYVVVQHMPSGFTKSLANRLDGLGKLSVKEAEDKDVLQQGTIYVAPGGKQLKLRNASKPEIQITEEEPYKGHRPAVNIMYQSLAALRTDKKIIAVIMTGMGSDGLEGVKVLKEKLNATVIAQNEDTCVVYGMPRSVVEAGLADHVASIDQIARLIQKIVGE